MLLSQSRGPSPDFVGEQELPAGRGGDLGKCQLAGPLVGDGEVTNLLDGVAEEVDPYGMLFGRREDVDNPAAHREFAASLHKVDPNVRRVHQGLAQFGEVDLRSDREPYRTKIGETLDLRLQDAADGSRDVQGPEGPRACIADGLGDGGVFDQQINKSRKAHRPNLPSLSSR